MWVFCKEEQIHSELWRLSGISIVYRSSFDIRQRSLFRYGKTWYRLARIPLRLLIGRDEKGLRSFVLAQLGNGTFPYMLNARWRRRPFCLQRNTTSRENPKGGDGKFLSRRSTGEEKAFLGQ